MAERSNAAVLKTVDLRGSGGSNPSLSADFQVETGSIASFFYKGLPVSNSNIVLNRRVFRHSGLCGLTFFSAAFFLLLRMPDLLQNL